MRALFMLLALVAMAAIPAAAAAPQAAPAAKPAAAKPAKSARAAGSPTAVVNINTATQAQLESLPGVGAKAAERILEYRQKNGQFKKIEDLMNVKGIGEKSFLKLKPRLTVTDKAAPSGGSDRQA
jgi:competence protein ComEA